MLEQPIFSAEAMPIQPPSSLYGRQTELSEVRVHLMNSEVVWIQGISGMGKHALAATLATEFISKSGGVLWLPIYHDNLLMLTNRFTRAYGVSALATDDIASQLEIVQVLLSQNHPLIVLDGPIAPATLQQFMTQVLPAKCPVMVIGNPNAKTGWHSIEVAALKPKEAEQLYRKRAQVSPEATRSAILAPLLNYIEGHALSLYVAGSQVIDAGVSSSHFTSMLPQTPSGPQNRALGVYSVAYRLLDSREQGVFLLCGALFVDRIGVHLLSEVTGAPETVLEPIMEKLTKRGFCRIIAQPGQRPVYQIFELAQLFARQILKGRQQLEATRSRILKGIYAFIEKHTLETTEEDYNALALEINHILGAARYATGIQDRETLQSIFKMLGQHGTQNVIHSRGFQAFYEQLGQLVTGQPTHFEDELATITQKYGKIEVSATSKIVKETSSPAVAPESGVRARLTAQQLVGIGREALQSAINEAITANDDVEVARLTVALAQWYDRHDQSTSALSNFQEAAALYEKLQDSEQLLDTLEQVIVRNLSLNRHQEALVQINRGIVVAQKAGNAFKQGRFLSLSGDSQTALGEIPAAIEAYKDAAALLEKADAYLDMGLALGKKAALQMDYGDLQESTLALAQAINAFERAGQRQLQGRATGNLGTAFGRMGRWKEAGQRHMLALQIARETEDIEEERYQLLNLAFVAEAETHYDWAALYYRQALYLALVAGDGNAVGQIASDLGRVLMADASQLNQAIFLLEHAATLISGDNIASLLNQAKIRHQQVVASGYAVPSAQTDLLTYTKAAYESNTL